MSSAPAVIGRRPILVTGGAGFIGSNLADRLARDGHDVLVYDALARPGVDRNLAWLTERHPRRISAVIADVRSDNELAAAARDASAIFHLAAQVAVTTSLADPVSDFEINVKATLALLEAVRARAEPAPLIFASTNKVYGDLADVGLELTDDAYLPNDPAVRQNGIGESRPLDFHTPYGCSKGAADQYVLDYARSFDIPTAVIRMSCIYGQRQMGTEDQGWVAHFAIRAIEGEPISIYGDGAQVRDVLDVSDAVEAYVGALRDIRAISGRAFNLGGGPQNAISLRHLIRHLADLTGREIDANYSDWRPGDQRYFVADSRLIRSVLGLKAPIGWQAGVANLVAWLQTERGLPAHAVSTRPVRAAALS
jgi:CDP-paratose 2-epimerase